MNGIMIDEVLTLLEPICSEIMYHQQNNHSNLTKWSYHLLCGKKLHQNENPDITKFYLAVETPQYIPSSHEISQLDQSMLDCRKQFVASAALTRGQFFISCHIMC